MLPIKRLEGGDGRGKVMRAGEDVGGGRRDNVS